MIKLNRLIYILKEEFCQSKNNRRFFKTSNRTVLQHFIEKHFGPTPSVAIKYSVVLSNFRNRMFFLTENFLYFSPPLFHAEEKGSL